MSSLGFQPDNLGEVTTDDIHRVESAAAKKPFGPSTRQHVRTLGTDDVFLHRRMGEMYLRKPSFSILHQAQEGRPELHQKRWWRNASVNRLGPTA